MGTNHGGVNFGRRSPPIGGQFSTLNNTTDPLWRPDSSWTVIQMRDLHGLTEQKLATWRRAHPLCRHTQHPYGPCMAVLTMC